MAGYAVDVELAAKEMYSLFHARQAELSAEYSERETAPRRTQGDKERAQGTESQER